MEPYEGTVPHRRPMASYFKQQSKGPMGIGQLGTGMVIKRKFRWTIEGINPTTNQIVVPKDFVKVAARPEMKIEDTELGFLNEKSWIPGKSQWQTMTVTYWDSEDSDGAFYMMRLAAAVYGAGQSPVVSYPKVDFNLELWDGMGCLLERWWLKDAFLQSVNWNDLDMTGNEVVLEVGIRYASAKYEANGENGTWATLPGNLTGEWQEPAEWIIRNPIRDEVTESSSPAAHALDQFLRRTASIARSRSS